MLHTSAKSPFDRRLACLTQLVRRELRGLDALSTEDSSVIDAVLADVRRANRNTMNALFPLVRHISWIDDCLMHRQHMWDITRAVLLWLGGCRSLAVIVSRKQDGFYGALERAGEVFQEASEATELAFRCGRGVGVATGRVCSTSVSRLQVEIENIAAELQDVLRVCEDEEENVKLKTKFLEGRLEAESQVKERLENEISGKAEWYTGIAKDSVDTARKALLAAGLAVTITVTIPGFLSFGIFVSISFFAALARWTRIFCGEIDTQSIQDKILTSDETAEEIERRLSKIKEKAAHLKQVSEAYKEAQDLFSALSPKARSIQLMTGEFETILSQRKTEASGRLARIRDIKPPTSSPLWYHQNRADVVYLLEQLLAEFKQQYEKEMTMRDEEIITARLEDELKRIRKRTPHLERIHKRIKSETEGIEDPAEMRRGSHAHLRLSGVILFGVGLLGFQVWQCRGNFIKGVGLLVGVARGSVIWTLKRVLDATWHIFKNLIQSLKTPLRLLFAFTPDVLQFGILLPKYLCGLFFKYAFMVPGRILLLIGIVLLRVFTIRLAVIGVAGWVLVYHGPEWDEFWLCLCEWVIWGVASGWACMWEFLGTGEGSKALVSL